jgi:hypothetical protein
VNSVVERYLGLRGRRQEEADENCVIMNFITCTFNEVLLV